ncbi:MAG: ABC transporter permease subunit [Actinomycetota bacterium]
MASEVLARRRMLGSVLAKTLRDQRRALVWWAIGLLATAAMYASFYPSIRANAETMDRFIESMPEWMQNSFLSASGDYTSPAGYLHTEMFSFFAPLLLTIFAIGAGARAIAGEEERQTLDVLLATPVSRRRVAIGKFFAMAAGALGLALVLWLSIVVVGPPFDLIPNFVNLGAAVVSTFLLAVAFGAIAFAVGCATGRRGLAIGVTSAIAGISYLVDILVPAVESLAWLQNLSLFHYYADSEPITNGLDPIHALVLLAIAAVAFALALLGFERRDLAT